MSAFTMYCPACGNGYMAGVVGRTPWPAHVCPVRSALVEAVATMVRSMRSDEATDAPFDEDMAEAIGSGYRALGQPEKADEWYRVDVPLTTRLSDGAAVSAPKALSPKAPRRGPAEDEEGT